MKNKKILLAIIAAILAIGIFVCISSLGGNEPDPGIDNPVIVDPDPEVKIDENGMYYSKEDVCAYLLEYGKLPSNFITKKDAKALGWKSGSVNDYKADGVIGGDVYSNSEKKLPEAEGRIYYVCDIDTHNEETRGTKRLIYSNDGLIYYTGDFYETFELMAGDPGDPAPVDVTDPNPVTDGEIEVVEDGVYYTKDEVALYIYVYKHLPSNFITKAEAKALGWSSGRVDSYKEGAVIGGDTFGNKEGHLPAAKGRTYTECDIDTLGQKKRGSKRIVFSSDGLVFYTEDHYETFTLLYGDENLIGE